MIQYMEQIRNLPIGVQSFTDIRERECVYVDKTQFIQPLLSTGKQYFLSRPRRFGKSLFLSTLEAYFLGKRELFVGLALEALEPELAQIQKREAWAVHPVFRFDFNPEAYDNDKSLERIISRILKNYEDEYGIHDRDDSVSGRFMTLIETAYATTGKKVVVLIDEYDKPLLNTIDLPELHDKFRTTLKAFYGSLKSADEFLKFVFITGITRFDKVSIFSDFNQMRDISISERFSAICGITQSEMENVFVPEINVLAEKSELSYEECVVKLKHKYDGYHFVAGSDDIYNPFSLLNAFSDKKFGDYWFATGTPTFLVKMLYDMRMDIAEIVNGIEVDGRTFESYHIDTTTPEPLLYQSGYLTIRDFNRRARRYTLSFPNDEVEYSFLDLLVPFYLQTKEAEKKFDAWKFSEDVRTGNVDGFMKRVQAIFSAIPKKTSEKYYELDGKQIFYLIFKMMGEFIQCEVQNGDGRSDAVVWTDDIIYVFEFKLDGTADEALAQIEGKNYTVAYQADKMDGKKVVKIGAVFSSKECNVIDWKIAE